MKSGVIQVTPSLKLVVQNHISCIPMQIGKSPSPSKLLLLHVKAGVRADRAPEHGGSTLGHFGFSRFLLGELVTDLH